MGYNMVNDSLIGFDICSKKEKIQMSTSNLNLAPLSVVHISGDFSQPLTNQLIDGGTR